MLKIVLREENDCEWMIHSQVGNPSTPMPASSATMTQERGFPHTHIWTTLFLPSLVFKDMKVQRVSSFFSLSLTRTQLDDFRAQHSHTWLAMCGVSIAGVSPDLGVTNVSRCMNCFWPKRQKWHEVRERRYWPECWWGWTQGAMELTEMSKSSCLGTTSVIQWRIEKQKWKCA